MLVVSGMFIAFRRARRRLEWSHAVFCLHDGGKLAYHHCGTLSMPLSRLLL
jgi:hypothetical protein